MLYDDFSTIRKSPNPCVIKSGTMGDGFGPVISSSEVMPNRRLSGFRPQIVYFGVGRTGENKQRR